MSELTSKEKLKLKTLCEFLFYDNYQYWATFSRFEKCFQPLFNNIQINLYEVFTCIAGYQKKYITFRRFTKAFLRYKKNEIEKNSDLYIFFNLIFTKILKSINSYVGKHVEYSNTNSEKNVLSFSTKKAGLSKYSFLNYSYVSKIQVLNDKHDKIKGIIIEYDDNDQYELYPTEIKKKLLLGLEINLGIINKKFFIKNKKINEDINISLYKDSITHIFGTMNKETNTISFLGFKCISGKTMYIGIPDGDSFLFGEFGKKFYNLRLEMKKDKGITLFEPGFIENKRKNYHLNKLNEELKTSSFSKNKNDKEEIIMDEKYIKTMKGDKLNEFITTSLFEESEISEQQTKEGISGYDYKEVVNQSHRDWIKNNYRQIGNYFTKIMFKETNDLFNQEKRKILLRKNTDIQKQENPEIYLYNPSQNPLNIKKTKEDDSKEIKINNPFYKSANLAKKLIQGLILHKSEELFPQKTQQKISKFFLSKSDSKINYNNQIDKNSKPFIFLRQKCYKDLKQELSSNIYKQFYDQYYKKNNINSLIPFMILNDLIPYKEDEGEKIHKNNIPEIRKRNLNTKGKKIEINEETDCSSELMEDDKNENVINSDAFQLWNDIKYNFEQFEKCKDKKNINKRKESIHKKDPEENWHILSKHLKLLFGINLLQTIRKIIIANNALTKKDTPLEKKIKYYNILTDKNNERIIKFLSHGEDEDEEDNDEGNVEEEEDFFLNKNPEMFNTLENLESEINNLKSKQPKEKLDEKTEIKYKKELNHLIQQKNILIENLTNKNREKLLENDYFRGFIFEEQRKRTAWEQDDENKLIGSRFFEFSLQEVEKIDELENIKNITFHKQDFQFEDGQDPRFIPCKESLCPLSDDGKTWKLPEKVLNSDVDKWEIINWEKFEHIKRIFYSNNAQPLLENIRQGEYIGDCYFLSALGSLCKNENDNSEQKSYLKNLVKLVKREKNKLIYAVKYNINGKWKHVLVDNYFPSILNKNGKINFCFGSSFKRELWVSLFEKAWAKINGCYARIACGGHCNEAFDALTDAYTELIHIQTYLDKREKLWEILFLYKKNNYVMCAGSKHFGIFDNAGLIGGHAYTLMNLFDLKEEKIKLVKLRNPWGEKEFVGDWSDKSSKWTNEIKKKANFEAAKDDGIFYMSYDDFTKYFSIIEILKIKKNYGTVGSCKIKKTEAHKCQIIKFELKEKRHIFINLYEKNPRYIRKDGSFFPEPVKSFMILARKDLQDKYTYIKSIINSKVHAAMEVELDEGIYYIFCDVNYRFVYNEIYGYNITFYSDLTQREIDVTNITNTFNAKKRAEILNKVIYNYYTNQSKEKKFTEIKTGNGIKFEKLNNFNEEFPFIILLLQNPNNKKIYLNCALKYENNEKNVCIYNDSDGTEFDKQLIKEIKFGYNIILLMGYTISDRFSFSYNFSETKSQFNHYVFNNKYKIDCGEENFNYYVSFVENRKGCILGLEKNKGEKHDMIIKLKGLNVIDPFYDDFNKIDFLDNNIQNIKFNMAGGDKIVFNLRFKADCEDFDYEIEH